MRRLEEIVERTFAIIKPDAVERNIAGKIIDKIESAGFVVVGIKKSALRKMKRKVSTMSTRSAPSLAIFVAICQEGLYFVMVLEKENAIQAWRTLMGATNPANADSGTIRKEFGLGIEENSVHGSDSPESAAYEIPYFFSQLELI